MGWGKVGVRLGHGVLPGDSFDLINRCVGRVTSICLSILAAARQCQDVLKDDPCWGAGSISILGCSPPTPSPPPPTSCLD